MVQIISESYKEIFFEIFEKSNKIVFWKFILQQAIWKEITSWFKSCPGGKFLLKIEKKLEMIDYKVKFRKDKIIYQKYI